MDDALVKMTTVVVGAGVVAVAASVGLVVTWWVCLGRRRATVSRARRARRANMRYWRERPSGGWGRE